MRGNGNTGVLVIVALNHVVGGRHERKESREQWMHVRHLNDVRVLFLAKLIGLHGCRWKKKGALFAMNVGGGTVLVGCGTDGLHECLKGGKLLRRARVNRATESDSRPGRKADFHECLWLVQRFSER